MHTADLFRPTILRNKVNCDMASKAGGLSGVRRLIISEILIVVLLILSFAAFQLLQAQKPEVQQKEISATRLNVDVFISRPVNFQELLTGFGTAKADREVIVAAQVSGEIVDIHPQLKVGRTVSAGRLVSQPEGVSEYRDSDRLVQIDPRDLQQRANQAANSIGEASDEIDRLKVQQENLTRQLKQAQTVLATLKEEYDRSKVANNRNVGTKTELNRALLEVQRYEDNIIQLQNQAASIPLQISAAEKRLSSSRADQATAENDLSRTEVYPPFDGVLSEVFVEKGRYVRTGDQLVRLTDPSIVEVPVSLGLDDFMQLQNLLAEGITPSVSMAENETADTQWSGLLVRAAPEVDSRSRTVEVYAEVRNADGQSPLLPGTFVYSQIDGKTYENTILIPREALIEGCVFVVDSNNVANKRTVTTGRRFQSLVMITDGLEPDEPIIITNLDIVQDGQEVSVQSTTDSAEELSTVRAPLIRLVDNAKP